MIPQTMMNRREAEEAVGRIRAGIEQIGTILLDLYEREGWKALGHESWRECVRVEFGWGKTYAYGQLRAARIVLELSAMAENLPANERQVRELARVDDPERRSEVWERAVAQHGPKVTAAKIREIAGPPPPADAEQAVSDAILRLVGDPRGARVRAELRAAGSDALATVWDKLLLLKVEPLCAVIEPEEVETWRSAGRACRSWWDALDAEFDRPGLRVVTRKEA